MAEEHKTKRRRVGKDGILSATRQLASEEGWRAVSVRKIADRIGYRAPVVYEYFTSKDDLLLELLRRGFAELLEALETARENAPDPEQALFAVGRAYLRFAWHSPDLYQVMYGLGGVSFPVSETWEEGEKVGEAVGGVVAEAMSACGKEPRDVEEKVLTLWSTAHGLVALTMAGRIEGGKEEAERLGERAIRDALVTWSATS